MSFSCSAWICRRDGPIILKRTRLPRLIGTIGLASSFSSSSSFFSSSSCGYLFLFFFELELAAAAADLLPVLFTTEGLVLEVVPSSPMPIILFRMCDALSSTAPLSQLVSSRWSDRAPSLISVDIQVWGRGDCGECRMSCYYRRAFTWLKS